ncbi:hypothetical protein CSUI_011002 [Cystoisospora suis]|uniref:Uncharacterized protein n=1 Tax=Cystoisospora suis TaxID=483139 RepID=A0A2C6KFD4_9APIC|nr:hypothetical protein CSUI_011002 [Cystoisospora suis]
MTDYWERILMSPLHHRFSVLGIVCVTVCIPFFSESSHTRGLMYIPRTIFFLRRVETARSCCFTWKSPGPWATFEDPHRTPWQSSIARG